MQTVHNVKLSVLNGRKREPIPSEWLKHVEILWYVAVMGVCLGAISLVLWAIK